MAEYINETKPKSDFACPKCNSAETQKLSVIYASGTSHIQTKSSTLGTGLTGLGRGQQVLYVGNTSTTGVQQTQLAANAAPPNQKLNPLGCLLLSGLSIGLITCLIKPLSAILVVPLVIWYFKFQHRKLIAQNNQRNAEFLARFHTWENSWLCHRCGERFTLDDHPKPP